MKDEKIYSLEEINKKFYPNGKDGDFVLDETFFGGTPKFTDNNIEIKIPKVPLGGSSTKLFYNFAKEIFDIKNNKESKEQLRTKINNSILDIEEKNMLLGYL